MIDIGWREGVEYDAVDMAWFEYYWKMAKIFDELDYTPSAEQLAFHMDRHRTRLVSGGERAGKSYSMAMDGTARAVYSAHKGYTDQLIWILGPDYFQPRVEFNYMVDNLEKLGFEVIGRPSMPKGPSSPWVIQFQELGVMETKTSSDIRKIASQAPDLMMMAEAAQQDYAAYLKARGRVAEKRGPLLLSGTFEGSMGWYADTFIKWQMGYGQSKSFAIPSWSNLKIYPGGREDPEIKLLEEETPPDVFMERYGAVPFKPASLVFPEFDYERNVFEDCVFDPSLPVEIAVDVGYSPGYYHVSALQIHRPDGRKEEVWQIDEVHVQKHTAEQVISLCKRRKWWRNVTGGVIDLQGKAHQGNKSQVEIWLTKGKIFLRSNAVGILAGIERHRTFIIDPATKLGRLKHNPNNVFTLKEYHLYKRPKDKENQGLKLLPIDRDNHAMKPLAYYLFDRYGPVARAKRPPDRTATLDYETGELY